MLFFFDFVCFLPPPYSSDSSAGSPFELTEFTDEGLLDIFSFLFFLGVLLLGLTGSTNRFDFCPLIIAAAFLSLAFASSISSFAFLFSSAAAFSAAFFLRLANSCALFINSSLLKFILYKFLSILLTSS